MKGIPKNHKTKKKNLKILKTKKKSKKSLKKNPIKSKKSKKNLKNIHKSINKKPKILKISDGQKIQKKSKISKYLKKSFFFNFFVLLCRKCSPLSFPILGGRDSTRAPQSSPFQKYVNLKKSQTITFFQQKKKFKHF